MDEEAVNQLKEKCSRINATAVHAAFRSAMRAKQFPVVPDDVLPPQPVKWVRKCPKLGQGAFFSKFVEMSKERQRNLRRRGLDLLSTSSVAVVVLAGSSDRRLGRGSPSGTVDIGLVSGKSIFQIYCERILRLTHLVMRHLEFRIQEYDQWLREKAQEEKEPEQPEGETWNPNDDSSSDTSSSNSPKNTPGSSSSDSSGKTSRRAQSVKFKDSDDKSTRSSGTRRTTRLSTASSARSSPTSKDGTRELDSIGVRLSQGVKIPLYIMCNESNFVEIKTFFKKGDFFGMQASDVQFFEQGIMPSVDNRGKVLLEEKDHPALHPNGGGGVFKAMVEEGIVADMKSRGVEHLFICSQDNLLARIADPVFIGYALALSLKASVKCMARRPEDEEVFGVFCTRRIKATEQNIPSKVPTLGTKRDTQPKSKGSEKKNSIQTHNLHPGEQCKAVVLEPRELALEVKRGRDKRGKCVFDTVSTMQFYFKVSHAQHLGTRITRRWHAIRRRQPHINITTGVEVNPAPSALNANRLEMFVGDALELTDQVAALVVDRDPEWAYVKHRAGPYCPANAIFAVSTMHQRWVLSNGGAFQDNASVEKGHLRCEVSPLVSYMGEDMDSLFKNNAELKLPYHCQSAVEADKLCAEPGLPRKASTLFLNPTSWFETFESRREDKRMKLDKQLARAAHEEVGLVAVVCSSSGDELPSTPSTLKDDRENWEDRIHAVEDQINAQIAAANADDMFLGVHAGDVETEVVTTQKAEEELGGDGFTIGPSISMPTAQEKVVRQELKVLIESAKDLRNTDTETFLSGTDPFVRCWMDGQPNAMFETPVVQDKCNPVWDYHCHFDGWLIGNELCFEVWNDGGSGDNELLGRAKLTAHELDKGEFQGALVLEDTGSDLASSLNLKTHVADRRDLLVEILNARGLDEDNKIKDAECYAVCGIVCKEEKVHTSVAQNIHDPVWDFQAILTEYAEGDALDFWVIKGDPVKDDEMLGYIRLEGEYVNSGHEGELPLHDDHGRTTGAFLNVKVSAVREVEKPKENRAEKRRAGLVKNQCLDPFENAVRNPVPRPTPMPKIPMFSNAASRELAGGMRKLRLQGVNSMGGFTLFGPGSHYVGPPKNIHVPYSALRDKRRAVWKKGAPEFDKEKYASGLKTTWDTMPEGQRRYQWTMKVPVQTKPTKKK